MPFSFLEESCGNEDFGLILGHKDASKQSRIAQTEEIQRLSIEAASREVAALGSIEGYVFLDFIYFPA